ncbi:MAG: hypothetical protein ABR583_10295 [Gaiellaceae bacterium]
MRAGACLHPLDWPWSSYAATVGLEAKPGWLDGDELVALFGGDQNGRTRLRAFVEDALERVA